MSRREAAPNGDPVAPSPSQTIGPFFHDVVALTGSNEVSAEAGDRIRIEGRVLDGEGQPVVDALVEIWQPQAADPGDLDGARGFARSGTVDDGRFSFDAVKTAASPEGGTPFVAVRLFARGLLHSLVTRIYFEGDNHHDDPLLQSLDPDRRRTLIAARDDTTDPPTYRLDLHLQGDRETVFFELRKGPA